MRAEKKTSGRWLPLILICVAALVAAGPIARAGHLRVHRAPAPHGARRTTVAAADTDVPVRVGPSSCGTGWDGGGAGPVAFTLTNDGPTTVDVYVEDVDSGKIFLDAETLGPGATRQARVSLGSGSYRFVCAGTEVGSVAGATVDVTGAYDGSLTPGVLPVTNADLVTPVLSYQHWVKSQLPVLHRRARRLTDDLAHGQLPAARHDWLVAHATYETLGAAYDAFGAFDAAINGQPTSGIPPPTDRNLEGFHKIEALLWHGYPADRILPYAERLGPAITRLQKHFGTDLVMAPIDIGLRAHEILENALQIEARGAADAGSHTELATIDANVTGTRQALKPLLPLLRHRDPRLAELQRWLDRLQRTVRSHLVHGHWTPIDRLSRIARMRLDADLSQSVELLSDVAVICDPVLPMPEGA